MKRIFDLALVLILFVLLIIPMLLIAIMVQVTSKGGVFYWSDRVGRNNAIFKMPKYRTMQVDTPAVATHLMTTLFLLHKAYACMDRLSKTATCQYRSS